MPLSLSLCATNNKCMKYSIVISLVIGLCGCAASELDNLGADLEKSGLMAFSYNVGGFDTFKCDHLAGQVILKEWNKTLKEAGIASWPNPDNYLELLFKNGHKYRIKAFIGSDNLKYSVLYTDGVYTGEPLKLENVCPGLEAHNKSLNQIGAQNAPPG